MTQSNPYRTARAKIKLVLALIILCVSMVSQSTRVEGQAKAQLIYQEDHAFITDIAWSLDGKFLVFQIGNIGFGLETDDESWFKYNLETDQLTRSRRWPLQPSLTAAQEQMFEIRPNTFIFASYDGRYIAYDAKTPANWSSRPFAYDDSYPIGIADLITGKHFITDAPGEEGLQIKWSKNSDAFTVSTHNYNWAYRVFYVSGFQPALNSATVLNVSDGFPGFTESGQRIPIYGVVDISSDGKKVLFADNRVVLFWNFADPSQSKTLLGLPAGNIAFSSQDDTKLDIVSLERVSLYDVKKTAIVKNTALASPFAVTKDVIDSTYLSPSLNAVALVRDDPDHHKTALYVVDLPDITK